MSAINTPKTKGIILAGGSGTRLYPLTHAISKQLQPIYDKPMIYYPLTTLMLMGIRDIAIISTPRDLPLFKRLLETGEQWGINFSYIEQPEPTGLPEAFILAESFIGKDNVCLILGDNVFYGDSLPLALASAQLNLDGAAIFGYPVKDAERYGVIEFDSQSRVLSIEEKPKCPKSNIAITGLYLFDHLAPTLAKSLKPSSRGETEIVDLLNLYRAQGRLNVEVFSRGMAWLDTGTHQSLIDAARFVATIQERQGLMIACPEEVAWRLGHISSEAVIQLARPLAKSHYGDYLLNLVNS